MRRIKSDFLFGFGLGIIITGVISLFLFIGYSGSNVNEITLSEEDIVKKAKEMGMIFASELPSKKEVLTDVEIIKRAKMLGMISKEEQKNLKTNSDTMIDEDINEDQQVSEEEKNVKVIIPAGMKSYEIATLLYEKQLIDDIDTFDMYLQNKRVSTILRSGEFEIPKDSTYDDIVNIIRTKSTKK